jgi:hypothetical protein
MRLDPRSKLQSQSGASRAVGEAKETMAKPNGSSPKLKGQEDGSSKEHLNFKI